MSSKVEVASIVNLVAAITDLTKKSHRKGSANDNSLGGKDSKM